MNLPCPRLIRFNLRKQFVDAAGGLSQLPDVLRLEGKPIQLFFPPCQLLLHSILEGNRLAQFLLRLRARLW